MRGIEPRVRAYCVVLASYNARGIQHHTRFICV
jgi:hypothetical protein